MKAKKRGITQPMTCFFTIPVCLIPLQFCSMEVDTEGLAVMGATLANGGICPTTGDKVLSASSVRDTLSLMYSCGMYNYSGKFAFRVCTTGWAICLDGWVGLILIWVVPPFAWFCLG